MFTGTLKELQQNLKMLPGIGEKTAQRLALFLVSREKELSIQLADSILKAAENFTYCSECNMLTELDPCHICSDTERIKKKMCIVQHTQDVYLIENTKEFDGYYFVLGNLLSPLDGIGPNEIKYYELERIIKKREINEIILAINPSAEGETTINFLADKLKFLVKNITRLSTGIPFGGDIEYSSSITLSNAFQRRYNV